MDECKPLPVASVMSTTYVPATLTSSPGSSASKRLLLGPHVRAWHTTLATSCDAV